MHMQAPRPADDTPAPSSSRHSESSMYVCICNALTDAQVREAIASGASRVREVYAGCGCKAQCGTCARAMLGMLRQPAPPCCGAGASLPGGPVLAAPTEA
jgi:bacterioferritin-associated ferredoxin